MTSQYFESICTTCYLNCLQLLYGYKITHFFLKKKKNERELRRLNQEVTKMDESEKDFTNCK